MNNERITLTMKEQRTNDIMVKLISKELTMSDAIRLTGLSERQLYRKKKNYIIKYTTRVPFFPYLNYTNMLCNINMN